MFLIIYIISELQALCSVIPLHKGASFAYKFSGLIPAVRLMVLRDNSLSLLSSLLCPTWYSPITRTYGEGHYGTAELWFVLLLA